MYVGVQHWVLRSSEEKKRSFEELSIGFAGENCSGDPIWGKTEM